MQLGAKKILLSVLTLNLRTSKSKNSLILFHNTLAHISIIDTTRLNLRNQIDNFIQQGVDATRFTQFSTPPDSALIEKDAEALHLTPQDSLSLYREGIISVAPISAADSIPAENKRLLKKRP